MDLVRSRIEESIAVKQKILASDDILNQIKEISDVINESLSKGGKVLLCGNGGSASDAMHIAGELVGRFQMERKGVPAIALNGDVTSVTSISNDYGYENVFARMADALMDEKDVLIGISTSGNARNVHLACQVAKVRGVGIIGLAGKDGGLLAKDSDVAIVVPEHETYKIQEFHLPIYHAICIAVEDAFF